jgi:hypothetical protein
MPPKHSSESIPPSSPHWEIPPQENFYSNPLEKELEKLYGKMEKLASELTYTSPPQSERPDFSLPRVPSQENVSPTVPTFERERFSPQKQSIHSEETSEEATRTSHVVSPFGSIPSHKPEAAITDTHGSGSRLFPEPHLFVTPPLSGSSENEGVNHGKDLAFDAPPHALENLSVSHPVFPAQESKEKTTTEYPSPEYLTQGKSGVSLQEIEQEFARLLGNRPPA